MTTIAFTSITPNYLAKARVFAATLRRAHPRWRIHVIVAQVDASRIRDASPSGEPFDEIADLSDLGLADRRDWLFDHSVVEMCTAVKGLYAERLLARPGVDAVLYFDPDIVVLGSLDAVLEALREANVVLTPHQLEPEDDDSVDAIQDNEVCCLRHGVFNLGFLAIRATDTGRAFARWWSARLLSFCRIEIDLGLFTDQRWVDLAPALFDGVHVLRDPGLNVATWNLTHRQVEGDAPWALRVGDVPISFFHFSGFDSGAQLWMAIKYGAEMPALFDLRNWYIRSCVAMGDCEWRTVPWSHGFYDDGTPIREEERRLYRNDEALRREFPDPFSPRAGEALRARLDAGISVSPRAPARRG